MPNISAALFATIKKNQGDEHALIAHALLFEGSKPYWEIHIGGKIFRFISHPDYLLEDGLLQLNCYCHIPADEYKHDQNDNLPITLEEEFGEEICTEIRSDISKELSNNLIHYKLVSWPGASFSEWNDKIQNLKDTGVNLIAA